MSCSDLTNASHQLKNACACQSAALNLTDALNLYKSNLIANTNAQTIYNNLWHSYQTQLNTWLTQKADKRKSLEGESKTWNNCVLWTGVYGHDNWCRSDTGFGRQYAAGQEGCLLGQGKGYCQRTSEQVNSELDIWIGNNPAPSPPGGGENGTAATCGTPCNPPSNNNILCCSQLFNDINAGKDVNITALQECTQSEVNSALKPNSTTPLPNNSIPLPNSTSTTPLPNNTSTLQNGTPQVSNNIIFIIILLIIFFITLLIYLFS